jgi:hypothetical protein
MDKKSRWGIFFVTAALVLTGAAAWAQNPDLAPAAAPDKKPTPETEQARRKAEDADMVERLASQLDLREDQQKKVKAIVEKARPDMDKLEAEMKALQERIKKTMFGVKESIRETLDMDQKMKFDQVGLRLLPLSRHGERAGRRPGAPGMRERGPEGFPPRPDLSGRPEAPARPEMPGPQEPNRQPGPQGPQQPQGPQDEEGD